MTGRNSERGQAFTLEGLVAGIVVLVALLFALQSVAVTPGAPGADIEPEVRQEAIDFLDLAAADGSLDEQLRAWDPDNETFVGAPDGAGYGATVPPTPFGDLLNETLYPQGKVVNVLIEVPNEDGPGTETVSLIYRGEPPSASTVATATITLFSNQTLTTEGYETTTIAEAAGYPIPNADPDGPLHNVVQVRVIVW